MIFQKQPSKEPVLYNSHQSTNVHSPHRDHHYHHHQHRVPTSVAKPLTSDRTTQTSPSLSDMTDDSTENSSSIGDDERSTPLLLREYSRPDLVNNRSSASVKKISSPRVVVNTSPNSVKHVSFHGANKRP